MDKTQKKEVLTILKGEFKKRGYKAGLDTAYKRYKDLFLTINYMFVTQERLDIYSKVKKTVFDDLLWEIMHFEDDGTLTDAVRAKGAFVPYSIKIEKKNIELTDDYDEKSLKCIVDSIEAEIEEFIKKTDISQYIMQNKDCLEGGVLLDGYLLKCLVCCEQNNIEKAVEIARNQIEKGETGRFVYHEKGFFEWMVCYGEKKLNEIRTK